MVPSVELTGCAWRKSSYSAGSGSNGNCVEIGWRKSSYSGGSGSNGDCVEVARTEPAVAVRDSKTTDAGNVSLSGAAWRAFAANTTLPLSNPTV